MAIDDEQKRAGAIGVGTPTPGVLPSPDGTVDAGDRARLAGLYPGLAAEAEDAGQSGSTYALEQSYWLARKQRRRRTADGLEVIRWFLVPRASYDDLKPTVLTDTAYDDDDLLVIGVRKAGIQSAVLEWMAVTYLTRTEGASPI